MPFQGCTGRCCKICPKSNYSERWRYAGDFRDGIAVVQADNGYSTHISADGKYIHDSWLLDLDVFHKGFARAKDEAGWMHINRGGKPVYTRRFAAVEPFYNGQARVEGFNGGLEIIDETGATLVELRPALRSEFSALSGDMTGFWRTQTIAAAVKTGIFDALPGAVADIAGHCQLQPQRLSRLLKALSELSLLQQTDSLWHCTERGKYLQTSHPLTLAGAAREYAGDFSRMWNALPEALANNGQWQQPDIFAEVANDETRRELHHEMLFSYAQHDYAEVPKSLVLRGDERIIDAGGGLGALANMLLADYPNLRISLLERPEVIAQAQALPNQNPGLEYHANDLFDSWGIKADVVILARVLHDWNDDDALRILKQARAVLPKGGRVFIVEMLMSPDNAAGGLCDLHLLMATGGQERSLTEYTALMAQAGFKISELRRLAALPSIIAGIAQ
ncbi:MAG: methyltransferase [Gammaproteobacteria bacterium]|nr:methyltransferase [Gammaproteobacteria bacterium]